MDFMLCLLLSAVQASLYADDSYINDVSIEEIRTVIESPDYLTVVIIYDSQGANSINFAAVFIEIAQEYHNYNQFYTYDCQYDDQVCPDSIKEHLPSFTIYVPAGDNPYTGKPLVHQREF